MFNSKEYKRSRNAYVSMCTFEYFVSLLVTDAFLAKLLTSLGINDALIGIISSFTSLAFVIQMMSIVLLRANASKKTLVITFETLSIFFFMFLYIVPFLPFSPNVRTGLIIISIITAYTGKYLVASILYKWGNSFVEPTKRASFSAGKEIISLVLGIAFTTVIGYIIDKYEGIGNLNGGFLFLACSLLVLNICNFVSLMLIKKDSEKEREAEKEPFFGVMKYIFKNKSFKNIIILAVLKNVAGYFTAGFLGVFKTKDLLISVFAIQVINMVASFARILVSKPLGRYSDKHSYAKGYQLGLYFAAASYLAIMFTTKSTWFLIVIYTILNYCSLAGTNQNSFNITYSYVEEKYISQAMAVKNCIGGICGFGASLLGGKVLSFIQTNGNQIFGLNVYGQQVLAGISLILTIATIIFVEKVIAKQKVMIQ